MAYTGTSLPFFLAHVVMWYSCE